MLGSVVVCVTCRPLFNPKHINTDIYFLLADTALSITLELIEDTARITGSLTSVLWGHSFLVE